MTPFDRKKFLIASILPHNLSEEDAFQDIKEVKELIDSYAGQTIEYILQKREIHDKGLYLGHGKIQEIADCIKTKDIDVVVLNAIVKPGHLFDMKKILESTKPTIEVWDRIDLILHIFSRHAHTTEAKLQIELAAMRHMGPRIYGMGYILSRQGGSIGTRGIGETNTELMKRHWRDQIGKVEKKLKKLSDDRQRQLLHRERMGIKTVSIVGYTNAGKTSLFNLLTGKKQLVENALFATLDSHVGKLFLPDFHDEIVLSDTIGFIRNLPASLINAFRSTLMESLQANLLLHVIDASDEDWERKILTVKKILKDLGVGNKPTLYILNKSDQITPAEKTSLENYFADDIALFISVKNHSGITKLSEEISTLLREKFSIQITKQIHIE